MIYIKIMHEYKKEYKIILSYYIGRPTDCNAFNQYFLIIVIRLIFEDTLLSAKVSVWKYGTYVPL